MDNDIIKKIVQVSLELPVMRKDKDVKFKSTNYSYFEINQIIVAMKPILSKHGMAILQPLTSLDGKSAISTIVVDKETGACETFTTPLLELGDPQKQGGCITYFRRYALVSLFFMEAEDNDAQDSQPKVTGVPIKESNVPF